MVTGEAAAQALGDFLVPQLDTEDLYLCTISMQANFILWAADGFGFLATEDEEKLKYQQRLIRTILSKPVMVEYIQRKGGIPVVSGIDDMFLNSCSANVLRQWHETSQRVWLNGETWSRSLSAVGAVIAYFFDLDNPSPDAFTNRLLRAMQDNAN